MHMVAQETPATQVAHERTRSPADRAEALFVTLVHLLARQAAREALASACAASQDDIDLTDPAVEPGND